MTTTPQAKTSAERMREMVARRRAAGWKRLEIWVPPEHIDRARGVIKDLKESMDE